MGHVSKLLIGMALLGTGLIAVGQAGDPRAEKLYGDGVHAFYRGNYAQALRNFDLATAYDGQDPRVFYYRGVAKCRQGRTSEGRSDLQYGAQLEASQGRTDIGRSLQRLQGRDRVLLEQYRRQAQRLAARAPAVVKPSTPADAPSEAVRPATDSQPGVPPEPQVTGRAVSEIPEHLQDLPNDPDDPFIDQATGLLGQGEIQPTTAEPAAATLDPGPATDLPDTFAEEDQAEVTGGEADDPFADDGSLFGDAGSGQPLGQPTDATRPKRGPIGAIFRALTRGAGANPALKQGQELLESARTALPGGDTQGPVPSSDLSAEPSAEEDPFFDSGTTEPVPAAADPADPGMSEPADPDDPFAEDFGPAAAEPDLFATPGQPEATEESPAPADDFDPFADDTADPFADEEAP